MRRTVGCDRGHDNSRPTAVKWQRAENGRNRNQARYIYSRRDNVNNRYLTTVADGNPKLVEPAALGRDGRPSSSRAGPTGASIRCREVIKYPDLADC